MSEVNASNRMEDDPFEDSSSKNTGNASGGGGGAGTALPKVESNLKKFKCAIKENNASSRAVMRMLEEARQSWAKVANTPEVAGTTIWTQDESEKREIAKLSSEELDKKIGIKKAVGAKKKSNGQVKVYFAGPETKEIMEKQREWTLKLAATAQIASPQYRVLVHKMPLSFNPENTMQMKELEITNRIYIQGIGIQKAAWLKKYNRNGKSARVNKKNAQHDESGSHDAKHTLCADVHNTRDSTDCDPGVYYRSERSAAVHHDSMEGTKMLNIIQYNVNRSKNKVQHHFFQALDPVNDQVVVLQEPSRHPTEKTPIKYPAYHLVFPDGSKGRTCIYVSKQLAVDKWRVEKSPEANGDITSISIQTDRSKIYITNIYTPPPPFSHSSKELGTLKYLPELVSKDGQHILVGDPNLHHPRWGGKLGLSNHKLAEDLIEILGDRDMELDIPEGTITWNNREARAHSTLSLYPRISKAPS
ncbi:hypothetical protein K3495_g10108 [Podosphaera aphanis]|nr:hypothetical protein K3495_g10108 [Podosphaera aphanis]